MHRLFARSRRKFWRPAYHTLLLLLTLALPGAAPAAAQGAAQGVVGGIPILAWHDLVDELEEGRSGLTDTFDRFERMLVFLRDKGFRSVFPEQARPPGPDADRQVILTFDDGHRSAIRAAELMERYGFHGIFFVIPGRIHDEEDDRWLSAAEIRRLARAGHRVAAHGYLHRSLSASGEEVAASLGASLAALEAADALPSSLDFAFPFGHYGPFVAAVLGAVFQYLHTVNPGYWDGESPLLPRFLLAGGVDPGLYKAYLLGGGSYSPTFQVLTQDGAVVDTVLFRVPPGTEIDEMELLSVSADAEGQLYASYPIRDVAALAGDTLVLDLRAHVERRYLPERAAISYALVRRGPGGFEFLSPGVLHWITEPWRMPRRAPPPGGVAPFDSSGSGNEEVRQ